MGDYWISDSEGRVLGPVRLAVLDDLIGAGRVTDATRVSRDGRTWSPLGMHPELVALNERHHPEARAARQRAEAEKLLDKLEAMRTLPAHEVFKVGKDAPLEAWRDAFFKLSKRFHPDVVPQDAAPELRRACQLAFRFLSGLMTRAEAGLARPQVKPAAAAPPPSPAPTYDPSSWVGLRPLGPGVAQARIKVNGSNVGMFTDHPLMNLSHGGFFVTHDEVLPLGTTVALTLSFEGDPPYTIVARGRVAWEDAGKGHPTGFGVTFNDLNPRDRDFIKGYVQKAHTASPHR